MYEKLLKGEISRVPAGWWMDRRHRAEAIRYLVGTILCMHPERAIQAISYQDLKKYKLNGLYKAGKHKSIAHMIMDYHPEVIWDPRTKAHRVHGGWDSEYLRRHAVENLIRKIRKQGKTYITTKDFSDNGLISVLIRYYSGSMSKCLSSLCPDALDLLRRREPIDKEESMQQIRVFIKELFGPSTDHMASKVTIEHFRQANKQYLLHHWGYYHIPALLETYEGEVFPWQFSRVPSGYWASEENRRTAVEWLDKKVNGRPLKASDFSKNGLKSLYQKYNVRKEILKCN